MIENIKPSESPQINDIFEDTTIDWLQYTEFRPIKKTMTATKIITTNYYTQINQIKRPFFPKIAHYNYSPEYPNLPLKLEKKKAKEAHDRTPILTNGWK